MKRLSLRAAVRHPVVDVTETCRAPDLRASTQMARTFLDH